MMDRGYQKYIDSIEKAEYGRYTRILRIESCLECPRLEVRESKHKEGWDREFYCSGTLIATDGFSSYRELEDYKKLHLLAIEAGKIGKDE